MKKRSIILSSLMFLLMLEGSLGKDITSSTEDKTLTSTDAVMFLLLGLQDGARFGKNGATVRRVGGQLTSNLPYGFEIMDGRAGPSEIVTVKENTPCTYTMSILSYSASREVFTTLKPRIVTFNLDFSKAVGAAIVAGERRTSAIAGLQCTSVQGAEAHCQDIQKNGLLTAASGADLLQVFSYFQNKFCKRQK